MESFLETFNHILDQANTIIWHNFALYVVLAVGVLFTFWSMFCQYRALTHGTAVIRGKYDDPDDPGAINHFQALSAALSATVGLGNIGGVALAVALGGPGAVFWMWMIGLVGMALKTPEVTLSMLYRNTEDPNNPHGGPMFVAKKGMERAKEAGTKLGSVAGLVFAAVIIGAGLLAWKELGMAPIWLLAFAAGAAFVAWLGAVKGPALGALIGGSFVVTLLVSTVTGGNIFQAWNVGEQTEEVLGIPAILVGVILAVIIGMVIIGGIKRIGAVAGRLVPFMVAIYLLSAVYVLIVNFDVIPEMLSLIVTRAFSETDAAGAFVGGTWGYAFLWGMKRALFSSEAGQGSSPIAHSAAKTGEPVREAVVAGLEPFIDTIVVCTITSLVILSTGAWDREEGEALFEQSPQIVQVADPADGLATWTIGEPVDSDDDGVIDQGRTPLPSRTDEAERIAQGDWTTGETVFVVANLPQPREDTGHTQKRLHGVTNELEDTGEMIVEWGTIESEAEPALDSNKIFKEYPGALLTSHAFDRVQPGLGQWLVLIASWLFAISTMISWSYYGEQGVVFLVGERGIMPYKLIYCLLAVVATSGFIKTEAQLDGLTSLGTGVMLWANIPIMLIFGHQAMKAYHIYSRRLKAGEFHPHKAPSITEVVEGRDVEE